VYCLNLTERSHPQRSSHKAVTMRMLSLNMRQASKAVSREQASSGRDCSEAPFPASVVKQVEQRLPPQTSINWAPRCSCEAAPRQHIPYDIGK
jgi:hypothetical protein